MTQEHSQADERACAFLRINERQGKPRARGLTEIRGSTYTPMGNHYLQDVLLCSLKLCARGCGERTASGGAL
jgi:hypothetical protein